jgi:hypothetical protein
MTVDEASTTPGSLPADVAMGQLLQRWGWIGGCGPSQRLLTDACRPTLRVSGTDWGKPVCLTSGEILAGLVARPAG